MMSSMSRTVWTKELYASWEEGSSKYLFAWVFIVVTAVWEEGVPVVGGGSDLVGHNNQVLATIATLLNCIKLTTIHSGVKQSTYM